MTTTVTSILLGNYGISSNPLNVYKINNKNYYCIQDINNVFLNQELNTRANLVLQYYKSNPNDFMKTEHNNKIFIMTRTIIQIARLFNMYCLAELCKLSTQEILGQVAEPLLNSIQCDHWQSASTFRIVERDLVFDSLNGDEWLFITPPNNNNNNIIQPPTIKRTCLKSKINRPIPQYTTALLYQWISSNMNDPSMIQALISAAKVKKQQQAIIETRQRQAAFIIPTTTQTNNNNKKQKMTRGSSVRKSSSSYQQQQKQQAGTVVHDNNKTTTFPPSPPSIVNYSSSRKRKSQHTQQQQDNKKTKKEAYQEYLLNHGNDNLNLLATQATQMRGLPISPEVSPSPPPFYHHHHHQHQQRLPSIQVMLSELNNHHLGNNSSGGCV